MGARAITIMIGSILGAKRRVVAPNLTKCGEPLKRFVLEQSKNQNDVPMGYPQERFAEMQKSSETLRQTPKQVKIKSALMGNYERLAEMTSPSLIASNRISHKNCLLRCTCNPEYPLWKHRTMVYDRNYPLLYHIPRSCDYLDYPVGFREHITNG